MPNPPLKLENNPFLLIVLGWYVIIGCAIFCLSILVADFVVPDHDWIADTISDLGAGKFEYIVDIGIYAFSASIISVALLCAHCHLGGWRWNVGIVGFALLGLIVFLVGARNEYGDNDSDGVVIHVYLVYALGVLLVLLPLAVAKGASRMHPAYGKVLLGLAALWAISAPVFFFLPTGVDGVYERYLGLIAMAVLSTMAWLFIQRGRDLRLHGAA